MKLMCTTYKGKGKAHPLQAIQAQRGLGELRLLDFLTSALCGRLSASRTGRLCPQGHPWYSFSRGSESTPGPWFSRKEMSLKNPVTGPGIDPGTVRCTTCKGFYILCNDDLMTVWWPELVASKLNNKIFLYLTVNIYTFVIVYGNETEHSVLLIENFVAVVTLNFCTVSLTFLLKSLMAKFCFFHLYPRHRL
jgi:hypothetical protein